MIIKIIIMNRSSWLICIYSDCSRYHEVATTYRSAYSTDIDLTMPDFNYFDSSDESSAYSNGDSSRDAEHLVWPEDVKG